MAIPEFKRGDVGYVITATANMDLTGCTVRFLAQREGYPDPVIELAHTVTDAAAGEVEHSTDGTLEVGDYVTELEVMRGAEGPFTFPGTKTLPRFRVNQDLG
ncbi:hypothetical protein [Microbacterium sp. BR1]|uniref:hypothetical protein n=1 Tax=Microbacterium sp. BR1 TaxID=1070896 RepID=UPI000C2C72EA|nr:hypothetical protein [Microbacterium sp. BR1]